MQIVFAQLTEKQILSNMSWCLKIEEDFMTGHVVSEKCFLLGETKYCNMKFQTFFVSKMFTNQFTII